MNHDAVKKRAIMVALIIGLIVVGFPFYWMLLTSLTPRQVLFQPPYKFFRLDVSLENYRDLFFGRRGSQFDTDVILSNPLARIEHDGSWTDRLESTLGEYLVR